jgi:O-antigen ligase
MVPERLATTFDDGWPEAARSWRGNLPRLLLFAGVVLFCALCGAAVAVAETNALYLSLSLIGCAFILYDFRIGVVLLILLMPVSSSSVFPRAMLGITGLNPLNLLLVGTLASCLLQALFDGSIRRFMPRPLLWLYVVPFLIAGMLGASHFDDIVPAFFMYNVLPFDTLGGYVRDLVVKPLFTVAFALLVGAAVLKSEKPEKFLMPMFISIWVMGSMVIVFVSQSGVALGQLADSESRSFLSALGMHANDLGRLYAVAYALLLFTWAESKEPGLRFALLASMGMAVVALILTFSRGALIGFVVINALFLCWRFNTRTLIVAAFLAAGAVFALPDAFYDRITTGFGLGLNEISAGRIEGIWLPLLPEVLRSPVFGSGLGSILWSEAMRVGAGVSIFGVAEAHNAYLETVLDMGIAGLVLFCAYFFHVWKGFRALSVDPALSPTLRGFYQGAAAGLAGFLVAGFTGSYLTPRPEQVFLWLAIGMMYGQLSRNAVDTRASPRYGQAAALN